MPRFALTLVALLVATALLLGCSDDDSSAPDSDDTGVLALTSPAFADGEPIPEEYTLDDAFPPLEWVNVPTDTQELAIAVVDPDASNFVHWVVAGLDPDLTGLESGRLPDSAVQAQNGFGSEGWAGPQPPPGLEHTYVFTLYALTEPSGLEPGTPGAEAVALLDGRSGVTAQLRGEYEVPR